MGACDFSNVGPGKDADEAFERLVDHAFWEHGHGGYSGTICEKRGFIVFEAPKGISPKRWAEAIIARACDNALPKRVKLSVFDIGRLDRAAQAYDDKWGPAVCVPLTKRSFMFIGLASS